MSRSLKSFVALACLVALSRPGSSQVDDRFEIFFELQGAACGGEVTGAPGSTVEVNIDVKLTTTAAGTSGATLPIGVTGADDAELFGCDPTDPFVAQCGSRLIFGDGAIGNEVFQYLIEAVDPTKIPDDGPITSAQGAGAIYGIAFAFAPPVRLDVGTFTMGQLTAIIEVPEDEAGKEVTVDVKNGLQGAGTTKFVAITFEGASRTPVVTPCTFTVKPVSLGVIPGDTNLDETLDAMDAITLLDHYFLGEPAELPCGDGTIYDAANIAFLDGNGDDEIDLSDAIYLLRNVFLDGPPHVMGTTCTTISGCPAICEP